MRKKSLLDYARAGGCAGKTCQKELFTVLRGLPSFAHPDLTVTPETCDDAGVFKIDSERALVLTVDVISPLAEDPYTFGQIAAANSLSDVYAMGGKPIVVLAVLGFPAGEIGHETVRTVLAGAWDKVREADAVVAGGHTMKDMELKFGLAVVGIVHPHEVVTNAGAKPDDVLILTKPIGTGIITTGLKANRSEPKVVEEANRVMSQLNRYAAEAMSVVGVNAATDITGFGLLGHSWEIAKASGVDLVIEAEKVPLLPGVLELAEQGLFPKGTINNYEFIQEKVAYMGNLSEKMRLILCDAQTSGGLLISLPKEKAERLLEKLLTLGYSAAAIIGYVQNGKGRLKIL